MDIIIYLLLQDDLIGLNFFRLQVKGRFLGEPPIIIIELIRVR